MILDRLFQIICLKGGVILDPGTRNVRMWRLFEDGSRKVMKDEVLEETPMVLEMDGKKEASVILSSGNEKYWALGHLACRGLITSMKDVHHVSLEGQKICVSRARYPEGLCLLQQDLHTASTGLVGRPQVMERWPDMIPCRWSVTFGSLKNAVEQMSMAPLFLRTGSVHVAVLAAFSGRILFRVEDVGRHNAVDKAVGWAIYHEVDPGDCFLALSGRLPADMVYKAIGSGIPLMISVSAVTASGIDAAERGGITLIGFAREGRMNVYTFPERVQG